MLTATFIIITAWATFAWGAAGYHGRRPGRLQCIAANAAIIGALLALITPAIIAFGSPNSRIFQWLIHWVLVWTRISETGLTIVILSAATWIFFDTAFLWRQRRAVFPFAFRDGQRGDK